MSCLQRALQNSGLKEVPRPCRYVLSCRRDALSWGPVLHLRWQYDDSADFGSLYTFAGG